MNWIRTGADLPKPHAATDPAEKTWTFPQLVDLLNAKHDRLARLWPETLTLAKQLSEPERSAHATEWNALAYVQTGLELQLASALERGAGGKKELRNPLPSFAGLPGVGTRIPEGDLRFAVPKLNVYSGVQQIAGAYVGEPVSLVVIGAYIVTVAVLAVVLGWTIRAISRDMTGTTANVDNYEANMKARHASYAAYLKTYAAHAEAERKAGRTPAAPASPEGLFPEPPKTPPAGVGAGFGVIAAVAVAAGGLYLWSQSRPAPRAAMA